jgi:flagellin
MASTSTALTKSMERLSSGYRINRASDDAAGLGISEKLKAQIGGLNQAARNANDGISMIQTAEGGMDEIQNMMQRIRDLAVQAASDSNGSAERDNINLELQQLYAEIDSTANRTTFNGQGLLNGDLAGQIAAASEVQTGMVAGTGAFTNIDVSGAKANTTHTFTYNSTTNILTLTAGTTSATVDLTTDVAVASSRVLDFAALGIKMTFTNGSATAAVTGDTIGAALTTGTSDTLSTAAGSSAATLQTGAMATDTTAISFVNALVGAGSAGVMATLGTALGTYNTTRSQANASALITATDNALLDISNKRATLGAAQNRLEHAVANLNATSENLAASNSRIRDVDVAVESAALAKNQVLQQAGVSILAQANQSAQLALKLLG